MPVNINKFVDINIKQHVTSSGSGTRGTILVASEEVIGGATYNSFTEVVADSVNVPTTSKTYKCLKFFFDNGGVAARVAVFDATSASEICDEFTDNEICICFVDQAVETVKEVADYYAAQTDSEGKLIAQGPGKKIFFARSSTVVTDTNDNMCVKYSNVMGSEFAIAAYLSRIDVYRTDSIFDYMYTKIVYGDSTLTDVSDSEYEEIIDANMIVDINLAGAPRACGGNLLDGSDLVNTYCLILLHQTLRERLLTLLTEKIKGNTGISKIYATMAQELNRYVSSGYLTTDKSWTDADYVVNVNGTAYTIISQNTPLPNGYLIRVLPLSSLDTQALAERQAPNIYVIAATQYGIRKIVVSGETF